MKSLLADLCRCVRARVLEVFLFSPSPVSDFGSIIFLDVCAPAWGRGRSRAVEEEDCVGESASEGRRDEPDPSHPLDVDSVSDEERCDAEAQDDAHGYARGQDAGSNLHLRLGEPRLTDLK